MSTETLLSLAARCETAGSNSWDLDREIFKAVHLPDIWFGSKVISWFGNGPFGCNTEDGKRHLDCINAPNYTSSIDAAVMLVPEQYWWSITDYREAPAVKQAEASVHWKGGIHAFKCASSASVALALCAAALRARAARAAS